MLKPVGSPGLASLFYMVTVDRIRGTDAGVVLRSQVQVLKTLQRQKRRMVLNKSLKNKAGMHQTRFVK